MGEVYRAKDMKLNRWVALKVLRPNPNGDPSLRQRFLQEAQAASALNHPNIITIHDVVSEDELEIMVMELVAGRTLNELIPRGGLRVPQVIAYAAQIADALASAHNAGIIHRDLKPGNVMVTDRDLVKLLDFGLAKLSPNAAFDQPDPDATNLSPLTVQGSIVGTLCYMSPEQAQGQPADARSDIFSFGAVLYEMATGTRAFTGANGISMLSSVLRDEPRRVLEITPDIPPILSDVIHRCLAKDPAARFQSMAELRDTLVKLRQQSDSGLLYNPASAETVIVPPAPAAKPKWQIPAAVGVLAILAIGGWWFLREKPAEAPPTVAEAPKETSKPSPTAPESPTAPTPAPPVPEATRLLNIPAGTKIPLQLQTDIPIDAEAGLPLAFLAAADVTVDGQTIVKQGAAATGELVSREKKKGFLAFGRGTKVTFQLATVEAADGAKLKIRAVANSGESRQIESPGLKSKALAVAKGAAANGFTVGPQAIRAKH